jgi:hypothetical protein
MDSRISERFGDGGGEITTLAVNRRMATVKTRRELSLCKHCSRRRTGFYFQAKSLGNKKALS